MPPPFKPRRRLSIGRVTVAFALVLFTFYFLFHCPAFQSLPLNPRDAASNSTLGFEKIVVLSKGPSWRTRGLTAAAQYTGLDITIPKQPHVTEELIAAWQKMGPDAEKHPLRGEAYNWLAHLDLVKYIVANDWDTALIIEDDADWDVRLKEQMGRISEAVRNFTHVEEGDTSPYGRSWDVLWLGHCGEVTKKDTRRMEFFDPTVPPWIGYTGWSKKYIDSIAHRHRAVQRGINPVCTFGYALTRRGAMKVAKWAGKGENEAFDIRILEGCKGKHLSCVVVNPEVMHHYQPPREFGHISNVAEGNGKASAAEEEEFEKVIGSTANIVQSARCKVLFDSTCQTK